MNPGLPVIAEEAKRLAKLLPMPVIEAIASRLETGDALDSQTLRGQVAHSLPSPHHRSLVIAFFDRWRLDASEIRGQAVAAALLAAALTERNYQQQQSVELVWTGPDVGSLPIRRTEQAILQVLDSASQRITLVSYAVYRIPHIREALVRAARRGVRINVVVETPDRLEGENEYDTLRALGEDVAACSTVYYWPKEQRGRDSSGKLGILHVKCVVADGRLLCLSSANLTEYAFSINMELGVLITGGVLPERVERHFDGIIQDGRLLKL